MSAINRILHLFYQVGEYILLSSSVIYSSFVHKKKWSSVHNHFYSIGVTSLPVVGITGFSTGLVLAAQSFFQLADKGLASATGIMVTKAMLTELGPILTAFMITGRVGASMCAELGTMKVSEQIDAIESMAVSPCRYLLVPRFIAGIFATPLLTLYSTFLGVIGGYLLSVYFFGMSSSDYLSPISQYITPFDITTGIIKSFIFGIIIITVSCFKGINTSKGARGVGIATTQSVVVCYTFILIINFLMTLIMNVIRNTQSI